MSLQGKTVLIVDDNSDIRAICKAVCERLAISIEEATSGASALEKVAEKKPDLIVLDLNMPGMSGFDFLSIRKTSAPLMQIPVLVLTSHKDKGSVEKAIQLSATDYLLKPLNPSLMSHRLRKYLQTDFSSYRFPERAMPFLTLGDVDGGEKIGSKLVEVDETGIVVLCRTIISPGGVYKVEGETMKQIFKSKALSMVCRSVSMNPTHEAYMAYLDFDSADETLSQNVKKWKLAH